MHFYAFLFALLTILSYTFAEDQPNKNFHKGSEEDENMNHLNIPAMAEDDDTKSPKNENLQPKRLCTPAVCPRVYRPVCGLVDGIPLTAPTMCHFKDKERCLKEILEEGEKMPVFRFLHEGPCTDADPNILNTLKKQKRPGRPNPNRRRPGRPNQNRQNA